jgi:signal transduction histidine kinase/putative methionine-R-sulfoxide reductase with GAF domain
LDAGRRARVPAHSEAGEALAGVTIPGLFLMDIPAKTAGAESREAHRLEAFASIASGLAQSPDLPSALEASLSATLLALDLDVGGVYLLDEESGELKATPHHRGVPPHYAEEVARFQRGEGHIGRALASVTPLVVRDITATPEAREATRQLGVRTAVFVPLYARGRAVGVMPVGTFQVRELAPEELQLLGAVGGMLGSAIESARLAEKQRRSLNQVEALSEIDRAIVEDRELGQVLDVIAREATRLGGGEAVILLLEGEDDLRVAAVQGEGVRGLLGSPPSLDGTPVARFLLGGPSPTSVRLSGGPVPLRAVVVPLQAPGRTLGGLVVVRPEAQWVSDDLNTLATFGSRAAVALAKADARQAEGRRASQLALLAGASEIAASTLDVNVLPNLIARYIQRAFGYYSVAVYLVQGEARRAVMAGAAGAVATLMPKGHQLPFGRGIIGWVAEHGEYILTNDVRREPRFLRLTMLGTASELAVPVRLAGDVVAVINVESDHLDAFDNGDLVAVDGIAAQVASSIRNARVFEEKVRTLGNLEILQEITNVLNSELELGALLDRIARRSVEAVRPAQMGAVLLFDDDLLKVRSSHGYADPSALQRVALPFHEGLPGSVFVSGQGRLVRSSPVDYGPGTDAFREAAAGAERTGALCVPIVLPQEKLGVLLLESTSDDDAFQAHHMRFAATLADQAAIAIGNALRMQHILEMNRQRQNYLSNVSHELRTPLTVIQGYLEALEAAGLAGEEARKLLRVSQEQCQRLGRMIDEVLEVARLEQGLAQRHLDWGPVALGRTAGQVCAQLRHDATLKGLAMALNPEPELPVLVGDERLLHILVQNLVENAVKFTPRGGHVEVSLSRTPQDLVLRVTDDGIGIAPEHHDRIFEKFFMVDAGTSKSQGGAGIGLYLAREVVAIHGGTLSVESAPGRGACFSARLPLQPKG